MGSNQEIGRIQEWVANWYGTSAENGPFSREDIRNICRGPMREVLLDFLVNRFRTDAQIKVIRSNLFLTDGFQQQSTFDDGNDSSETNYDEEVKRLRGKLEETLEEKVDVVKQTLKGAAILHESEMQLSKNVAENLEYYDRLEFRMRLIQNRLLSTAALLEDIQNIKPLYRSNSDGALSSSSKSNEMPKVEGVEQQLAQLKTLYNKASELFDLYFLNNSNNSDTTAEIKALTSSVSTLTDELTQSGLKPNVLQKWAKKEQEISTQQLKTVEEKFSNVMNPVEDLANEADALYAKLMRVHINLYFKNEELQSALRRATRQKDAKIQRVILNDASIVPADYLSFIQKEEYQKTLMKCRELAKQFRSLEHYLNTENDNDLLSLICGESCDPDMNTTESRDSCNEENRRSSLSTEGGFHSLKQETLEDLTCALLKSFPEGRSKLETTVEQSRNLIEKFANLNIGEHSINNNRSRLPICERETNAFNVLDVPLKVPHALMKQDFLLANSAQVTTSEQSQMEMLNEVFKMQNELKESRLQCEALFRQ